MSDINNRGVDEVAFKNNYSKWNNCVKVINGQINNLDDDERAIYNELYTYWSTSSFNGSYCKKKIEALKLYDKCHKGALLSAIQDFRRRSTFFYVDSENNFKAFQSEMKAAGASASAVPQNNATQTNSGQQTRSNTPAQPQAETIDEMVGRWRQVVRSIKENQDQVTIVEQTCFEQLENFHQSSAEFDPNGSSELIATLLAEVKKRGENDMMYNLFMNFMLLCVAFYTKSEDTYFEFQNTVRPRRPRATSQSTTTSNSGTTTQSRPVTQRPQTPNSGQTTSTPTVEEPVTPPYVPNKRASGLYNWICSRTDDQWTDAASNSVMVLWVVYAVFSFISRGFWGGLWHSFLGGVVGFVIMVILFMSRSVIKWIFYNAWTMLLSACILVAVLFPSYLNFDFIFDLVDNDTNKVEVVKTPVAESLPTTRCICTTNTLNVRSQPNSNSNNKVIGTIRKGEVVFVYKILGEYALINFEGKKAYVSAKYLGPEKDSNTSTSTPKKETVTTQTTSQTANQPKPTEPTKSTTSTTTDVKPTEATSTPVAKPEPTPAAPATAEEFYNNGVTLAKQFKEAEAIASLKKAVDMGSTDATYYLGMMYVNGGENTAEGFELVLKAANAGHKEAIFQVAELYNAGTGTSKDKTQAKVWYQKAEALGDARATARLRKL